MTLALHIDSHAYVLPSFVFYVTLGVLMGWFAARRRFRR